MPANRALEAERNRPQGGGVQPGCGGAKLGQPPVFSKTFLGCFVMRRLNPGSVSISSESSVSPELEGSVRQ